MGPETRVSLTTRAKGKGTSKKARPAKPARRPAPKAKPAPRSPPSKPKPVAKHPVPKAAVKSPAKPPAKVSPKGAKASAAAPAVPSPARSGDSRFHVLSLSFLRDGDEFMARLETDAGQITELKNRSLDQLLTLVAGELEDLLE